MNIAIITSEIPYPDNSGGRKYTLERIKMLKKNNNVFLYSIIDEQLPNESLSELMKYCNTVNVYLRNKSKLKNFIYISRPFSAISRFNKNLVNDLKRDMEKKHIDILIVDMPQLMYNIPPNCNVPVVVTQHNIEYKTFINIAKNTSSIIKKVSFYFEGIKLKIYEDKFYKKEIIKLFTFISEKDKSIFESKYNKNTVLIPMGIQSAYKKVNKKIKNDTVKNIIFTGKMNYFPNVEAAKWFCRDVFPQILSEYPNIRLYLVGKDPTSEVIELQNDAIIVTGTVKDVKEYLDMADIVVIPLLSGGGVKIKLLEALANGNIVVTTDKGIEGTEFRNKEHVLVANDKEKFCESCLSVLENENKYKYLIDNCQRVIDENYSWNSIGEKYNKSLQDLLKG